MTQKEFQDLIEKYAQAIEGIRESAHALHASVNQTYGGVHPYGFHLDMVADNVERYGHHVCGCETDILPLFFGAYYHDSMEDARLTYNDVKEAARQWMDDEQVLTATEIVYALTNDKGRTRAERAGENYYSGIRTTPYAPFVKLADRLANITYSFSSDNESNTHMQEMYRGELPHFLQAIDNGGRDNRLWIPQEMADTMSAIVEMPQEIREAARLLIRDISEHSDYSDYETWTPVIRHIDGHVMIEMGIQVQKTGDSVQVTAEYNNHDDHLMSFRNIISGTQEQVLSWMNNDMSAVMAAADLYYLYVNTHAWD